MISKTRLFLPKTRQAPTRYGEAREGNQQYTDNGTTGSGTDSNPGYDPHMQGRSGYAMNEQQAFNRNGGELAQQNHGSMVDPQLWVRIPYPLSSYFQQPDRQIQTSGHHKSVNADSIYRTRGWFDLGATQMRELTDESVENAGSSVNAEPSIKLQVNFDEYE